MQQTANLHQFLAAGLDPKSIAPDRSSTVAKRRWPFDHVARRRAIPRNGRSVICHYANKANTPKLFLVVAIEGAPFDDYMPQRKAGVCTGASQRRFISSSSIDTVTEQPAISSDVTKLPTSDRVTMLPAGSSNRRTTSYIR